MREALSLGRWVGGEADDSLEFDGVPVEKMRQRASRQGHTGKGLAADL